MIFLKTSQEISVMREGGKKLAEVMAQLISLAKPRIATKELDKAARALILDTGAQLAFEGYDGFPGAICTSVNEEVVHAVPSSKVLKEGDLLTLDIGLVWRGFFLDMARTVSVGNIDKETMRLLEATRESLNISIAKAKAGNTVGDIGYAVQEFLEGRRYGVVRELCGHGIGRDLHEDPKVLNYGEKGTGTMLKEGMVICIEPMVTAGDWRLKRSKDGHGFETKDGSLSCHFEDTIAITSAGPRVLTRIE